MRQPAQNCMAHALVEPVRYAKDPRNLEGKMNSGFADGNIARRRPQQPDSAGGINVDWFSQPMPHARHCRLAPAPRNIIEVKHLNKEFVLGGHTVHAVRDVSFTINRGEFVAIMGPSGSGKSTLMNIIGCLDTPCSGIYKLEGIDVSTLDNCALAKIRNRKIGFIFQHFNLLPRSTALENVELPLRYNPERIRGRRLRALAALSAVGLSGFVDYHPSQMSGGQQQRVAIARAIVNDPEILLADEPTGALDSQTSAAIMGLLRRINREQTVTVILVTHQQEIAQNASRIIRLRDGRVVGDEPAITASELVFSQAGPADPVPSAP